MPTCASVRRTDSGEVSTVRMISSFSDADISCDILPIREHAFFKQAVLQRRFGQRLLQLARLGPQRFDLVGRRLARRIAGEPALAGLQELLRPAVIHALRNALLATELGDTGLAAQPFKNNADLLFCRILPPCR